MGTNHEREKSLMPRDKVIKPPETILSHIHGLTEAVRVDALQRIPLNRDAQERVNNAIEKSFKPYATESEVISAQLLTPEYQDFIAEINNFLEAIVGYIVCPDGRILVIQLGDPKIARVSRRLQGKPPTRPSTRDDNRIVPNDPYLSSSITTEIQQRKKDKPTPEIIQMFGPHIYSVHPDHGCGDETNQMVLLGHTPEIGMEFGGIPQFFDSLKEGFFAFDNIVKIAGGKGNTFDVIHDTHSQGLIYGLREAHKRFDPNLSLRENLLLLKDNQTILMTEFLDPIFEERIKDKAKTRGITEAGNINMFDYYNFAQNAMLIGRIAKEITVEEGQKNFSWIPRSIIEDKTETAARVLAYHAIRNSVFRVLGGIKPGAHHLLKHPEKVIRIGPIGADFNVSNIPFSESTVPGPFQESDIQAVETLYRLSYSVLKDQGVNLKKEARIILVTGIFDPSLYADEQKNQAQLTLVTHIVQNNAAWIREKFKEAIKTGEVIVIGALHEPGTRRLTHIV